MQLCGGDIQPYISHPTRDGEKLFLLFDFTHNLKNIFNNWLKKSIMHLPSGFPDMVSENCKACFHHIKELYAIEEAKPLKIAFALKKNSLNPNNIARTSPQHALSKCNYIPVQCTFVRVHKNIMVNVNQHERRHKRAKSKANTQPLKLR